MTARVSRYVAGAAAGLALTASLTACRADAGKSDKASGSDSPSSGVHLTAAQTALEKASQQTGDLKSFRATLSTSTVLSGQETNLKGTMAFRLKPDPAMKFDVPSATIAGKSTAGFSEILIGDKIYIKVPALAGQTGKPWVGFSLSDLSKSTGIDVQGMESQGRQVDPSLNGKMLTASKDVRSVGKETVDGVSTTHYKGTFMLNDALAKLDADQKAQAQKLFTQAGLDKLDFNAWIDGKQLPRKITMATPPGAKTQVNTTMNYTGFNVPVSISAPPQSEVADGAKLKSGAGANVPG